MISIIIPAHNEEQVIGLTLAGLFPGILSGEFEVIVVCNACSDQTANIVRSTNEKIKCIEVDKASKTNALNVGDTAAHYFPRVYLDADIRIAYNEMLKLTHKLEEGDLLAVSPCMKMDLSHSSWMVRAYYEIWSKIPYCQEGLIGVGTYALSQNGRSRFGKFPDILADDGYIRLLFRPEERGAVNGTISLVTAPSRLNGLIKIKTRSRLGEYELGLRFPDLFENDNKDYLSTMKNWLTSWQLLPKVVVYILVNIITRIRAKAQIKHMGVIGWERDESSRSFMK